MKSIIRWIPSSGLNRIFRGESSYKGHFNSELGLFSVFEMFIIKLAHDKPMQRNTFPRTTKVTNYSSQAQSMLGTPLTVLISLINSI